MASPNRGARLTKLVGVLKKKFKPTSPEQRPLFESLLYACLVENSPHEAAAKALGQLESGYFDWNEVRVSTRAELSEVIKGLNDPAEAADRLKRTLQSVFESVYAFDLEAMKKQNLGQSVKQIAGYDGVTPFAVAYVAQNGLGGHAIALNKGALLSFRVLDLISEAELKKGVVPGLERAVPKNKGVEIGTLVHQLGVEVGRNPYGPAAKKVLLELDPGCKDRLPKRPAKPVPAKEKPKKVAKPAAAVEKKQPEKKAVAKAEAKPATPKKAPVAATKKADAPAKKTAKAVAAKKPAAKKKVAKKAPAKPAAAKKKVPAKKKVAKKATKKAVAKKAPVKKKTAKKPAKKKAAAKSRKPR